jgi:ketosteroid isomerase-like protein
MPPADPAAVGTRFIDAFSAADFAAMRSLLADGLIAWVTNADGSMERAEGADAYLSRVKAMDLPSAQFTVTLTQPPTPIDGNRVLLMVEVHAEREGEALHNFAAHLLEVVDGRVAQWWMADAKPAESDAFWSQGAATER